MGSQGEEDHPQTSPARHQGRRGVGHPDQGHHCWRWSHPPHPQVSDWKERRGWSCSSVNYYLYCTVLYCTVLYCTVLYCTVLYCTTVHSNTVPPYLIGYCRIVQNSNYEIIFYLK